jgi:hypothetical protein
MTKETWKRFGIGAGVLAVLAVGVALSLPSSQAAISAPVVCTGSKDHIIHIYGGPPVHVATTGSLTAGVGPTYITPDGRQGTSLSVQDVFSTGNVEGLGTATFKLDATRKAGPSSIEANQKGQAFPATQTMRFHFTFDLDGATYRSITPATVTNTAVSQFPPAPGTTYVLTSELQLEDVNKPGVVAITMDPGKAFTIN